MNHDVSSTVDIQVTLRGHLPGADEYAIRRIDDVLRFAPEPVLSARVKLTRHPDPAVERPIVAQANLDLRGRLVRAQASGVSVTEAVDLLHDRLRRRLLKFARNWEAQRGHHPHGDSWRHGHEPTRRAPFYPRPLEEREIVRHKTFSLSRVSVSDAAAEMEALDYDFHLFTELASGQDSVLYRTDTGYRLAQLNGPAAELDTEHVAELPVTVSEQHAARLSLSEAVERLNLSGLPFLFFQDDEDPGAGRGCVLYHRFDGHYGLIVPAYGAH